MELTATQLADSQGNLFGMSVILRDISERKQREREIQQLNTSLSEQVTARTRELAEKVEALARANAELHKLDQTRSEFVSLVSHQIRAPLTNMSGAVQRMQSGCQQVNPTCARMFTVLQQQTTRLDRLVQAVLSATRLESGELDLLPEPVSIQPIAEQVVDQIRARAIGRSILLPHKPGLPLAFADRDRVAEVLTNLIDNADKYSPPDEAISVDIRADQTTVTVAVRDGGPGLPPTDLERVFDKFYRTDSSDAQVAYGYGLGLYVCRQLVEAQKGRIWAENAPDGGAIFSFSLPVWQDNYD
jgi:K+-sensing histidine kinase KdpD